MFNSLSQNSIVYIIDKTKDVSFKEGTVISNTSPVTDYSNVNMPSYIDIKVKTETGVYDFNKLNTASDIATYNNGTIIISETKEKLVPEVESIRNSRQQMIDNVEQYKKDVSSCEQILTLINPQFAKDKQRDERINGLESKVGDIGSKLDKVIELLNKK